MWLKLAPPLFWQKSRTWDQEMEVLDKKHPEYALLNIKGIRPNYTLEKLAELGPLPEYRRSFSPVKKSIRHGRLVSLKDFKIE